MAINNRDRVSRAFDLLSEGLIDVVDPVMTRAFATNAWTEVWASEDAAKRGGKSYIMEKEDVQTQLRAITEKGREFSGVLSRAQQSFASELRETRNQWAHGRQFSSDDTARALDTIERLLRAVDAVDSADDVRKLRLDLQRTVYEEQKRKQAKRVEHIAIEGDGMKPWREVIRPHEDVARGEFTASEFAADLHTVHAGLASGTEYADPVEFFSRTYITDGLRDLLTRALRRLTGDMNASPVVNLQTNFGGGKTHSMLALYHLFSGIERDRFPQEIQDLVAEAGNPELESLRVKRVALVGTDLQAGSPQIKDDGTEVRTLWGELAWQLGGREAYAIVAEADETGTNPGDALRTLISQYSPTLILIDEWVAYARQLVTERELPAGSFETQFTFAQSLTEIVRSIPGAMLVVSIPASDRGTKDYGSQIEIGGENGRLALERLQNVIRRVADQWRPSSKDESFEIVRRRLFQPPDANGLAAIAAVARSFTNMYRKDSSHFPRAAANPNDDYERRIRASYPLHPELLDRLYEDWSALERFQRTRGVLKLVSSIVHELWASNDTSPLILPGNVPLAAASVNTDLTQYLENRWKPIIDSDIDGADSTASRIDKEKTSLGARFITQRLARTIFMGVAPRTSRKGLDKQYVWLGTAIPGDALGNFAMAIEQLAQRSTYFYEEQGHYWFDTQPSVTKTASDHAERLREDPETVWNEIVDRLRSQERKRGVFARVHAAPETTADIPDVDEVRLVIVHPRRSHRRQDGESSPALKWVREAVESKGTSQRVHRNMLVFAIADANELERLESATRSYLGWKKVRDTSDELNLTAQQRKQAEESVTRCEQTVEDRLGSTYTWTAYPEQPDPTGPFRVTPDKVPDSSDASVAERIGVKLVREDQIVTELGPSILGAVFHEELATLWEEKGEIGVGELWGYFTRYPYMHRLAGRSVLDRAIETAASAVLVEEERFAIAADRDEKTGRYRELILPPSANASVCVTDRTLLVEWERAKVQHEADHLRAQQESSQVAWIADSPSDGAAADFAAGYAPSSAATPANLAASHRIDRLDVGIEKAIVTDPGASPAENVLARFFGSVRIDPGRYARDIGNVTREVIDWLAGAGAKLDIRIDIQATKLEGFDESEVRTIGENARTLKFDPGFGFEKG